MGISQVFVHGFGAILKKSLLTGLCYPFHCRIFFSHRLMARLTEWPRDIIHIHEKPWMVLPSWVVKSVSCGWLMCSLSTCLVINRMACVAWMTVILTQCLWVEPGTRLKLFWAGHTRFHVHGYMSLVKLSEFGKVYGLFLMFLRIDVFINVNMCVRTSDQFMVLLKSWQKSCATLKRVSQPRCASTCMCREIAVAASRLQANSTSNVRSALAHYLQSPWHGQRLC